MRREMADADMTKDSGAALPAASLYAAGYCPEEGGPGGLGAVVVFADERRAEVGEGYDRTTVNRMSMRALEAGLAEIPRDCEVVVHTESKYIADAVNKRFATRWRAIDWRGAGRKPLKNVDLWQRLVWALGADERRGKILWLERGSEIEGMRRAETLARMAAMGDDLQSDGYYITEARAVGQRPYGVAAFDENADPNDYS